MAPLYFVECLSNHPLISFAPAGLLFLIPLHHSAFPPMSLILHSLKNHKTRFFVGVVFHPLLDNPPSSRGESLLDWPNTPAVDSQSDLAPLYSLALAE